jgi:glycosyltransferase involved in cell wall biosynthesis
VKVSVVIDNKDYAQFVGQAIDSCLAQTYADVEVIVVDDGSTDGSWDVISSYGSRVTSLRQENQGQAGACNAGFAASTGEVVLFLDSDDLLYPGAVEVLAERFSTTDAVAVPYYVDLVSGDLAPLGGRFPPHDLPTGDLRDHVALEGPVSYGRAGPFVAYARGFLEQVMPVPCAEFHLNVDTYLNTLSPTAGSFCPVPLSLGMYRRHGRNDSRQPLDRRLRTALDRYASCCVALAHHVGASQERRQSWYDTAYVRWVRTILSVLGEAASVTSPGDNVLVIENGEWLEGPFLADRQLLPFPHRDGVFWGAPASDQEAVDELRRELDAGTTALVVPDTSAWWVDQYPSLRRVLAQRAVRTSTSAVATSYVFR